VTAPAASRPTLFRHQQELLEKTAYELGWIVAFEQGVGKSAPTIHNVEKLFLEKSIDAAIVVAPNGVHRNWVTDELPKHSGVAWRGLDWHSDRGKGQDRALAKLLETKPGVEIPWLTITYDGLLTPRGRQAVLDFHARFKRIFLIIDEGSYVKNPEAQRTKKVAALRSLSKVARVLNGTPITNSPLDIYAQVKILDPLYWVRHGIGSFTAFRSRFAVLKRIVVGGDDDREAHEVKGKWAATTPYEASEAGAKAYEQLDLSEILTAAEIATVTKPATEATTEATPEKKKTTGRTIEVIVGYRELDKLKEMVAPIMTRVTKEDAGLDLPPKLYSRLFFDLTTEQRRVYDKLRLEFMVELDSGTLITAPLALTRILRLQQIACGFLPDAENPDNPKQFFNDEGKNPRLQLLMERLEDTPHQGIIWARFTPDVNAICRMLGPPRCARYDGEVSERLRADGIDRFRGGKAKFIVAKAASMGVGLTLTEAKSVFYYSNTFSLFHRVQSEDRCHRIGQTNPVNYYDLVGYKTVDEKLLQSLREDADVAAQVTGDKLREWLEV
jgi:SNF2 family DNA or RNA helicase